MSRIKEMLRRFFSGTQCADPYCFLGNACSDVGLMRSNNEDNYLLGRHWNEDSADYKEYSFSAPTGPFHLVAVFDGIGGGEAGELASTVSAKVFAEAENGQTNHPFEAQLDILVRSAFETANRCVLDLAQEPRICGTTGTVLCTDGKRLKVFHLGDSRAYLFRKGKLLALTKDQTLAQLKIDSATYNPHCPSAEMDRHRLTHYIGKDYTQCVLQLQASPWLSVFPEDKILLCSDGLYDMCSADEITRILAQKANLQEQTVALIQRAKHNGGLDNITCILIDFL